MGLDMYLEKTERVLPENSEHSENQLLLLDLAKQWLSYTLDEETCTFKAERIIVKNMKSQKPIFWT